MERAVRDHAWIPAAPVTGLAEKAYLALRELLVTTEIPPGAALDEDKLMARLQVGRTPVREAIKRLALENLVTIYPRRGTFASHVDVTDLALISDVRAPLEGHAALRATQRLTAADRAELHELVDRLRHRAPRDSRAELEIDSQVHHFVYRCARNTYLADALDRYYRLSLRLWHLAMDRLPPLPERVDEHLTLLRLIEQGDAEGARQCAIQHVRNFERGIRDVI